MEVVYLLIPIALLIAALVVWLFFWAIRSGQFDDLEGPAHRILMDDDRPREKRDDGPGNPPGSGEHGQ